jgi:hypothetical protein
MNSQPYGSLGGSIAWTALYKVQWACKKGDANTKYFQIMTNIIKKNNFIASQSNGNETATNQPHNHRLIFEHFQCHIGSSTKRKHLINYAEIGWQP